MKSASVLITILVLGMACQHGKSNPYDMLCDGYYWKSNPKPPPLPYAHMLVQDFGEVSFRPPCDVQSEVLTDCSNLQHSPCVRGHAVCLMSSVCCLAAVTKYQYHTYTYHSDDGDVDSCDIFDADGHYYMSIFSTPLHIFYNNACRGRAVGPSAPISGGLCSLGRAPNHTYKDIIDTTGISSRDGEHVEYTCIAPFLLKLFSYLSCCCYHSPPFSNAEMVASKLITRNHDIDTFNTSISVHDHVCKYVKHNKSNS